MTGGLPGDTLRMCKYSFPAQLIFGSHFIGVIYFSRRSCPVLIICFRLPKSSLPRHELPDILGQLLPDVWPTGETLFHDTRLNAVTTKYDLHAAQSIGVCIDNCSCRVWRQTPQSQWQETWVEPVGVAQQPQQQMWRDILRPASDPLLLTCLRAAEEQRQQQPAEGPLPWLQGAVEWALGPPGECDYLLHMCGSNAYSNIAQVYLVEVAASVQLSCCF